MSIEKLISGIIEAAKELGLGNSDVNNSIELLENREYGLAFDTVVTQLYEYDIEIDNEFYSLLERSAKQMKISEEEYSFMKELVRTEDTVPRAVKDRLSEILALIETKN